MEGGAGANTDREVRVILTFAEQGVVKRCLEGGKADVSKLRREGSEKPG